MSLPPGWQFATIEQFEAYLRGEDVVGVALTSARAGEIVQVVVTDDVGEPPNWCPGSCHCGLPCGSFDTKEHATHRCLIHG